MLEKIKVTSSPLLIEDLGLMYPTETSTVKYKYGIFKCQCGVKFKVLTKSIKSGHTKSCGCLKTEQRITHGLYKHPLYNIWKNMVRRTTNNKLTDYKYYGGKGIAVCKRWMDINNFIEDMYPSFKGGLTIDRINNDGNYEPNNCRWATKSTQSRNQRIIKNTNTSGYRGVSFHKSSQKWSASIRINCKQKYLGLFNTALEAGIAYDTYVIENGLEHTINGVLK